MVYLLLLETEDDREYFRQIYEENYLKMYHVALGYLKQTAEAENAVHEAFLSLAENFQKYSHISGRQMTGFCVSIVKNKSMDSIRRSKHYSEDEMEEWNLYTEEDGAVPESVLLKHEEQNMVRKALQKVSEVFRETLILKYVYGLSNKEIAHIQGVSVKTVTMRIYRGKQKLKEVIHEAEME